MEKDQKNFPCIKDKLLYRPAELKDKLGLISALSKECERIEYDHLYAHAKEHDLLSKEQSVFSPSLHVNNFARCNK